MIVNLCNGIHLYSRILPHWPANAWCWRSDARIRMAGVIHYTFHWWYRVSRDEFIGCKNCSGPISPCGEALSRRAPASVDKYHVERTPTTIISGWPDSKVDAPGSVTSSEHRNTRAIKWKWDRDSLRRQKWRLPERGGESGGRLPCGKGMCGESNGMREEEEEAEEEKEEEEGEWRNWLGGSTTGGLMHRSPDFNPPEKAPTCTSTDCFVLWRFKEELRY